MIQGENDTSKEISLIEIFYNLKKKKYVLLLFIAIALIIAITYKMLATKEYTYESSFSFLIDRNTNERSSLLGNSSILKNDNLYLDINISDENSSINAFKNISPNSYEDILNANDALLYFAKLPLYNSKKSLLDSLKETHLNNENDELNSDISLIKTYFNNKKVFTSKYNNEKNIVLISVTTKNKLVSKYWAVICAEYLTKYIQNIQNKKIQEQFSAIEKAIEENKHFNVEKTDNKKLYETIEKILAKQLYEYKLKVALIDNKPFNIISTNSMPEKLSTPLLLIITIIAGAVAGIFWILGQKIWIDEKQKLTK